MSGLSLHTPSFFAAADVMAVSVGVGGTPLTMAVSVRDS